MISQTIAETSNLSREEFINEVVPAGKPLVIRNLVSHWPLVKAAQESDQAFCDYLMRFDRGLDMNTMSGPSSTQGRIFYNQDLSGINCRMSQAKLGPSLQFILEHAQETPPPLLAMQSIVVPQYLPGLERANILSLLPENIYPRIWVGGKATVAAHYDTSENIACCVAGRREFTLFPPEQIANLYVGPLELTPAGATISMVDLSNPDYARYPKFSEAEKHGVRSLLNPGDAIFIPYLWWHNVRSLDNINALMNYWWGDVEARRADPKFALFHAMMAVRYLPENHRDAWKHLFDHYVFNCNGDPGEHLPESRRGILARTRPDGLLKTLRASLAKVLSRN